MSKKQEPSIAKSMARDESFLKFLRGPGSILTEIKDNDWPAYKRAGKAAGTFSEEVLEPTASFEPSQTSGANQNREILSNSPKSETYRTNSLHSSFERNRMVRKKTKRLHLR